MSDSVDPDVLALSQSLKALEVGTVPACLKFAKDLCDQGILNMERLKKMPTHKAKKALEIVKMSEFQIDAIMEAITAGTPAPASQHAPAPASAAQQVCKF